MGKVDFRQNINYPPWIGNHYSTKGNIRLLIIGRSYFDARYRDKTIQNYIGDLIKDKVNDTFYSALELVLSDGTHWKNGLGGLKLDRKKFWNSVCFHQFIQGILNDGYTPPGKAIWKQGQEIYKDILRALQPDIVVMAGPDQFNHMPTMGGKQGRTYSWQGTSMKTWTLNTESGECRIACMANPRESSFNTAIWKDLYQQFISDYKNKNRLTGFSSN